MRALRTGVTTVLTVVALTSCSTKSDAMKDADAVAAQAVAASAFPVGLEALSRTAGVAVNSEPGHRCPTTCPTTAVRVAAAAAKGALSMEALLARLEAAGWSLGSTTDSAGSCTSGPQALPCLFDRGAESEGSIRIYPGTGGSYELVAARF